MNLNSREIRLLLAMLSKDTKANYIRPGEYTGQEANDLIERLKEAAGE